MTRRRETRKAPQQRALIASTAARLIAEDGISGYAAAKRKAARMLGLPDSVELPDDSAIESELRTRLRLFQDGEQQERLLHLRTIAAEKMRIMQRFNPYLSGSVADGSAGRHAEIDIQLFTDSAKDVEIFLLNSGIDFRHVVPRSDRAEAVLCLDNAGDVVNLIVYPPQEERVSLKTRDGRVRERLRLPAVLQLVAAGESV
ncbi:hypothetical protein [Rhodocyclus tenuis]|uniref:Nucleotidyltransferase n=1 Tax=Rhodocyclus tenuis TaxID=1066 RepID=A0A840FW15_RHOTE|nr:hypothetical protein [Rhodocyclus tenuis]MBB4246287.1 hypothetical protein [Rhodocyclus tenuis]